MAAKKPQLTSRINLNLLYPQGVTPKILVKFIKWLVAYGRFIVVIVEIIVLGCFVYRFKLDEDLNHQKESINNQVPYLDSLTPDEAINIQTQLRLKLVKSTYTYSKSYKKTLDTIAAQTPAGTKVSNINIDGSSEDNIQTFKITSRTPNTNEVAIFLNGLRATTNLSEVTLASISFDQDVLNFTISGKIK